jgi:hypothetical protein
MKVFNPKTKKNQDLFETLIPTYMVACTTQNIVVGDKGAGVYLCVSAENEEQAKDLALKNEEFVSHLYDKENTDKKHLKTFSPKGNYVIGRVDYYEGDPRL